MLGSEVLDIALGLILVYLLLSLFATAVREAVESKVKARAVFLEMGIRELLGDPAGNGLAKAFYQHPIIFSLYQGAYRENTKRTATGETAKTGERMTGGNLPAYIPSRSFSAALVDLVVRGPTDLPDGQLQTEPPTLETLRAAVGRMRSAHVQRSLLIAIDNAEGDLAQARRNIEAWFDASMERVSGWYKRRTSYWLLVIGVASTVALNVNTITIAQHLARSKAARELVVSRAGEIVAQPSLGAITHDTTGASASVTQSTDKLHARLAALESLSLPIGWNRVPSADGWPVTWFMQQFVGLLLTAFAITLGAPFWFDALNKIMTIRSTVKPKEKAARA